MPKHCSLCLILTVISSLLMVFRFHQPKNYPLNYCPRTFLFLIKFQSFFLLSPHETSWPYDWPLRVTSNYYHLTISSLNPSLKSWEERSYLYLKKPIIILMNLFKNKLSVENSVWRMSIVILGCKVGLIRTLDAWYVTKW